MDPYYTPAFTGAIRDARGAVQRRAAPSTDRPDAYSQVRTPYQGTVSLAAGGIGAIRQAAAGAGAGKAFSALMGPVPMAIMFSNPKGRLAQMAADKRYLGASKSEPYFSARTADVGGLKDVNVRKVSSKVGLTGQKTSASPFQADIDEALTDLARKTAVDDAVRAARPKVPLLEQVRRGLGKRVPSIAAGAAMLPLGVAAVVGLDRANRAASSAFQRAAESGRFNRAMRGFDPSQMGDPSFQYRYEQDPQGMMGALRESFGVLNRIAPNVAKDPTLAREYMKRLTLDPEYRQPPEEYLRQVQGAVQLENALQSAQPSLFEGLGTAPGMLLKGI